MSEKSGGLPPAPLAADAGMRSFLSAMRELVLRQEQKLLATQQELDMLKKRIDAAQGA